MREQKAGGRGAPVATPCNRLARELARSTKLVRPSRMPSDRPPVLQALAAQTSMNKRIAQRMVSEW
jgi:hypothetical protein